MAFGDVVNGLKKKVEKYLYGDEAEPRQGYRQEENYAPAPDAAFSQQQGAYAQAPAGYYQQAPQPMNYAQPQQPVYQQASQPVNYQQPAPAPQQPAPAPQQPQRGMFGRQEKVVNIKDYQQPGSVPMPEEEKPAQPATCRVVCARGMMDCRMAITLLRAGDAVLVTMENVKDPAEMRRLVDTLSGACYSLNASITKVSRYGVYLLAPQSMVVFADQMINQMNGAAPRAQRPQVNMQPGNVPQRPMYTPQQQAEFAQQPQMQSPYAPQEPYAAPQQPQYAAYQQPRQDGFTQRMAAPQENAGAFYARPQQQPAQMPAFSSQSANSGYVPDEMEVAE